MGKEEKASFVSTDFIISPTLKAKSPKKFAQITPSICSNYFQLNPRPLVPQTLTNSSITNPPQSLSANQMTAINIKEYKRQVSALSFKIKPIAFMP